MKFTVKWTGFSKEQIDADCVDFGFSRGPVISRRIVRFPELTVKGCGCTIESGLLSDEERDSAAKSMLEAVWELGPSQTNECERWLGKLMHESGIVAVDEEEATCE